MKRQVPILIVIASGMFMVVQFFVPHETSEFLYEFVLLDWLPIIMAFALALGVFSLVRSHVQKVRRGTEGRLYSLVTLVGIVSMSSVGIIGHYYPPVRLAYTWQFTNFMVPITSTLYALLAFFMASAAYRAFRARSAAAAILLVAALVVMIRFFPLGALSEPVSGLSAWILGVPNLAAKRAIIIGIGLGMVSTAVKVILGIERSYLGRD